MENQPNPPVDDSLNPPKSDRRAQTSAANGRKSRGPKTPKGKARAARNNLRHGILSRNILLESESPELFRKLLHGLRAEHQPATLTEAALVDTMAIARWRQMRLWSMEKSTFDYEIHRQEPNFSAENRPTQAALAFRSLSDTSRALDLIQRYETRCDRQFSPRAATVYRASPGHRSPQRAHRSNLKL